MIADIRGLITIALIERPAHDCKLLILKRRDVGAVDQARLESVCRGNSTEGSNPSLSASSQAIKYKRLSSFTSLYREWAI